MSIPEEYLPNPDEDLVTFAAMNPQAFVAAIATECKANVRAQITATKLAELTAKRDIIDAEITNLQGE